MFPLILFVEGDLMNYVSTRDVSSTASAAQAIVLGLAPGGGLYVPDQVPVISLEDIGGLVALDYPARAARVLAPWLTEFSAQEIEKMCRAAYRRFDTPLVAPVRAMAGGLYSLELWHGPTLAFKDMALQLLPRLLASSSKIVGETRQILILVATSGDTGKAALEGFQDVPGVSICVFYPEGGVSQAQKLQMVTQEGDNTRVVAVRGNFDDAQTGVKKIFSSPDCILELSARGVVLSSANSINLGRLVPQIAYYFSAYADMVAMGAVTLGGEIDICVPTGNFGNILAAEYARQMGLPVNRLVCASNENNVLTDFIDTGVYDRRRAFHLTTSPSMDILISSNLERLLFEAAGRDDRQVRTWMDELKNQGVYRLDGAQLDFLKARMAAGCADQDAASREIRRVFEEERYLIDPHTAVAVHVARQWKAQNQSERPMLVSSTASPYKFGRTVLDALSGGAVGLDDFDCCKKLSALSGVPVPSAIADLPGKKVRHQAVCDVDDMWAALLPAVEK